MTRTDTAAPPTARRRPRWLVPLLVVGAVALAGALALFQPWLLWVDEVAEEQLPTVASQEPTTTDQAGDDDGTDGTDGTDEDGGEEATAGGMDEEDAALADAAAENAPSPEPSPTATGPVELATGEFISRDHATSGRVAIVELEDGSRVLTIEDLQTDNGPDLYVYLDDTPADGEEAAFDDGVDLGRLRGNVGDLVYELPEDLELDGLASVAIWCDRFASLFGAADLVWS